MAVILEGPDAAGKSTLANLLGKQFGMQVVSAGGAPKTVEEVTTYCDMQLEACRHKKNVIDRVTPISHPIYNPRYRGSPLLQEYLDQMIALPETIFVYCRPPTEALMRPEKHQWKDYDTEEDKQKILNNQMVYIDLYDEAFAKIPHLGYDYTIADDDAMVELVALIAATAKYPEAITRLRLLSRRYCNV